MAENYKAPIVKKTFKVLRRIARTPNGLTLSDLARELGIGKSTVHGIISALEEEGAIIRDPRTKKFALGVTLFELGRSAHARIDLKDAARPFMEELMAHIRESVFLGVRNLDHVTIIDIVESTHNLKITSPVGTTIPLLAGATGKLFLAAMPEGQVTELLRDKGLPRYTEHTITDQRRYLQEIRKVRREGVAFDDEEYISGVRAAAAPIKTGGQSMSAIWVVGFKPSMNDEKMQQLVTHMKSAVEGISRRIDSQ
ncbi:MAG: IclR family transcriptional regulator [Desulfobacterales bacterium]